MIIYNVSQVTRYLKNTLEGDTALADIWIRGDISNLSRSQAGHFYFTLKDAYGQLHCVLFRQKGVGIPLENGVATIAHGYISLYEARGELQLYVDLLQPEGMGIFQLEWERLKAQLEEEGLFEPSRKRPLPTFPQRIGVVTSPTGAVLHDIINIVQRRYPLVELIIAPTPVQGDSAADGIAEAFRNLNEENIDLVILARGGGSWEELWAFNQEKVARAIYASHAPVVSGVGHETDLTIADLVADVRAPTPSAAAELAVPDRLQLEKHLHLCLEALASAAEAQLSFKKNQCQGVIDQLRSLAPPTPLYRQRLTQLKEKTILCLKELFRDKRQRLHNLSLTMNTLNPQATLNRGYAIVQRSSTQEVVSRAAQVHPGDSIDVWVRDGSFLGQVTT
ncbi:MAG: exodeoxyribonuclease VII large subunit [Chloroflexi bacterium]|nr:exodeoxyribonuclease VII large subunit [Chloroflexota bacterium]